MKNSDSGEVPISAATQRKKISLNDKMSRQLRILVPVKRVLDSQLKPRLLSSTQIDTANLKFSINPFDDIAIEESLLLKKRHPDLQVSTHAITIGPSKSQDILRNCLAKGIDKATLISNEDKGGDGVTLEPLKVAHVLKEVVSKGEVDLIIMGKQAIDDDFNMTGQMIAGLLNWSQATNVTKLEIVDGTHVRVVREVDGGKETLLAKLPLVITTDLGLNTPRYVKLQSLMKAKKKPIEKLDLINDFPQVDLQPRLKIVEVEEPETKKQGVILNSVDELIAKLKESKLV